MLMKETLLTWTFFLACERFQNVWQFDRLCQNIFEFVQKNLFFYLISQETLDFEVYS